MTRDDIIRMAREAGMAFQPGLGIAMADEQKLERFATLVASERDIGWHKIVHDECEAAIKEEREACAKVCEDQRDLREEARAALRAANAIKSGDEDVMLRALRHDSDVRLYHAGIDKCAAAIRARGQA